jgi:hypothetical protein
MNRKSQPPIVVYFNGTFVNLENGAHARLSDLLKFLDRQFNDVTLYSYANHGDCPWTDNAMKKFTLAFPRVKLRLEKYSRPLRLLARFKNLLLSFFPQCAPSILHYRLPHAAKEYSRIQSQVPDAVWIINYADGVTQLNGLPKARKIIVETHDLKFVLASKVAKGSRSPTSLRNLLKLRNEIACLNAVSGLVSISPQEKAIFQLLTRTSDKFYIPAYFKFAKELVETYSLESEFSFDLLFVASDNTFNVRGFNEFAESNASWLYKYRICLAGLICRHEKVVRISKKHQNICLLGYVPELSELYKASKAVISPTDGTGLKIKVVEALLHGKPVFGSVQTRGGLPSGYEGCVFPIERPEIESILNISENRQRAETAAFKYVRTIDSVSEMEAFLGYLTTAENNAGKADRYRYSSGEGGEKARWHHEDSLSRPSA